MTTRTATIALVICLLISAGFMVGTMGRLPDPVAGRFGTNGEAVMWMSRASYAAIMIGITVAMPLLFTLGLGAVIRWQQLRLNIPHRDYWLADERRPATVQAIMRMLIGLGCLHALFMAAMHGAILHAHATAPPTLSSTVLLVIMVTYVLAIGAVSIFGLRQFRRPKA